MSDTPLVVLRRKEGPSPGLTEVTVATGAQGEATVVVSTHKVGTDLELQTIRHMLDIRAANADALKGIED